MSMELLASKYAHAFFSVFPESCVQENIAPLKRLHSFFVSHKDVLFFLGITAIHQEDRKKVLRMLIDSVGYKGPLDKLCMLLLAHKRIALIVEVCNQMRLCILDHYDMLECEIAASCSLSPSDKEQLARFFSYKTNKQLYAEHVVDTTLIAGIALRSVTYTWEYSIRKQLHNINQTLIT